MSQVRKLYLIMDVPSANVRAGEHVYEWVGLGQPELRRPDWVTVTREPGKEPVLSVPFAAILADGWADVVEDEPVTPTTDTLSEHADRRATRGFASALLVIGAIMLMRISIDIAISFIGVILFVSGLRSRKAMLVGCAFFALAFGAYPDATSLTLPEGIGASLIVAGITTMLAGSALHRQGSARTRCTVAGALEIALGVAVLIVASIIW
ncbi:hypothetical protein HY480_04580 [Candidatus Uhrbacteria bacterium]|nr:hypothetical protein [Candidatus Uhrbacteria bacterium]